MLKRLLPFFCLFIALKSLCQDYSLVNTGKSYLFQYHHYSNLDFVDAIRIDSFTTSGTDSIFFNFKKFVPNPFNPTSQCSRTLQHTGSMGIQILKYANGDFCFLNTDSDSIFIQSAASVNDTWTMYRFNNGNTIEATLNNISATSFIGVTDTVKTITLQARDSLHNTFAHPLNNKTLAFSKNYGFVQTLNLLDFPNDTLTYAIYGQTNPAVGQQNLTARDLFNFSVGDIFQTLYDQNAPWFNYKIYTSYKVLSKYTSANSDTVIYIDSIYQVRVQTDTFLVTSRIVAYDSIASLPYIFSELQEFDKLPGEPAYPFTAVNNGSFQQGYSPVLNKRFKRISPYEKYVMFSDSCWNDPIIDGYPCWEESYEGIGGTFFTTDCQSMIYHTSSQVVYYHQGADSWGTPVNFDSLLSSTFDPDAVPPAIQFYPNPFTSSLQLHFKNSVAGKPYTLILVDILGNEILRIADIRADITIERNDLSGGVYFYSLFNEKQKVASGKLVAF